MRSNVVSMRSQDELGRQLDEARRHPMLAVERELELARAWRDRKDGAAARELVASHLRLVIRIARGYRGYGFPLGELIAEGNLGLVQALGKFDPERGFRFATYAMWWIKAAIQEHILHNWSMVKLGTTSGQKKLFFNLRRLKAQLGETGGGDLRDESVRHIARELAVETGEVVEMNRRLSGGDASLNAPIGEEGEHEWGDLLADDSQELTRGSVKLLREFLEDKRSHEDGDRDPNTVDALTGKTDAEAGDGEQGPQDDDAKGKKEPKEADPDKLKKAIIQVKHDDRPARLILNRRPPAEGWAWLKYEDDGQEFEADLGTVQLVALLEG